jgi:hypothetical protein
VISLIGSHAVKLDTPKGIHPVFHMDLLKRLPEDPLPSQEQPDHEPPEIQPEEATKDLVEGEYRIEKILRHKKNRKS